MNEEKSLILHMAEDNTGIAALALKAGNTAMARQHLLKALAELDLAESCVPVQPGKNSILLEA